MIKIKLTDWDTHCADGCCSEWGTRLEIDGVEITEYADVNPSTLSIILNHLKIEHEITENV